MPIDLERNNLDKSLSPYLQQHHHNPVRWQEWSREIREAAERTGRLLFVSVGYATCHWCHVMAREAFSDSAIARELNTNFIPVKVDREERPDLDQFLMSFQLALHGQGGWPLNVFLSPEGQPFFSITYASTEPRHGIPGFLEILRRVRSYYQANEDDLPDFQLRPVDDGPPAALPSAGGFSLDLERFAGSVSTRLEAAAADDFLQQATAAFDHEWAGFGTSQKFPPHSTLLRLLYSDAAEPDGGAERLAQHTLDVMQQRGLHDHLGGGFFRYCVDRAWTIPHFEKMLYDQALCLSCYSLAAAKYERPDYALTARRAFESLERDFRHGALYVSAHDADTEHGEGATYLWSTGELNQLLDSEEWKTFQRAFELPAGGNFAGKHHLVLRPEAPRDERLDRIKARLFQARTGRRQPFVDRKLLTGWNALAGVGAVLAARYAGVRHGVTRATEIYTALRQEHDDGEILRHFSLDGKTTDHEYLFDYAALLLLATFLAEDDQLSPTDLPELEERLLRFHRGGYGWIESDNADFGPVAADPTDLPIPSGLSLADLALARTAVLTGREPAASTGTATPLVSDARALPIQLRGGLFHIVTTPEPPEWPRLPIHLVRTAGERTQDCYAGVCRDTLPRT